MPLGWLGLAALVGTAGAQPTTSAWSILLLCKGIISPVTLGRARPPLYHQPHGASSCCAHPATQPSPTALPHLYLDNFFTHFIYKDSPPSANTLSFLLLWSGRPILLFYSY